MRAPSFVIDYKEDESELALDALHNLWVGRVESNKPCVVVWVGGSGEGKSYSVVNTIDHLYARKQIDLAKDLNKVVAYTPLEYGTKLSTFLKDKTMKKYQIFMVDEAREVMKAKHWNSFINQAISDVNALSRGIKPVLFIVVTQSILDIDRNTRRTMNFYVTTHRPRHKSAYIRINKVWIDDYDLEKPRLRKTPVFGIVKKGKQRIKVRKLKINFHVPREEVRKPYDANSTNAKQRIINRKFDALIKALEAEYGESNDHLGKMAEFYANDPDALSTITRRTPRGKLKVKKEAISHLQLSDKEKLKEFEEMVTKKLEEKGLAHVDMEG